MPTRKESTPVIQSTQPSQQNITPQDLTKEQDVLLLAGSKVSFRDVYNEEIDIPIHRNKYYAMTDVDNVFVLINGILTDVAEQAFRTDKALTEARKEASDANDEAAKSAKDAKQANELVNVLRQQLAQARNLPIPEPLPTSDAVAEPLPAITADVGRQLQSQQDAYSRLAKSSSEKMAAQQKTIDELKQKLDDLQKDNKTLSQKLNAKDGAVSQKDYNLLQYRFEQLQKMSTKRIAMLTAQSKN